MNKIKDRIDLCILAGGIGGVSLMAVDFISSLVGISQRSYRVTAAGVWVSSRRQAESWQGQLLGTIMNLAISMVGAFGLINLLSKYGRDKIIRKGLLYGTTFGAVINAIVSGLVTNKVRSKDAASNLSYMVSSAVYGVTTALVASKVGHDSLYDVQPYNDYLKPTRKTSEQYNQKFGNRIHLNLDESDKSLSQSVH